ncbi:MAG: hypothetical protein DRJ40_07870 [Thermoprotei archaeon]|nr:MAG: hypothetical protein DRJ40_07870 [Thermoprotei archaeon]
MGFTNVIWLLKRYGLEFLSERVGIVLIAFTTAFMYAVFFDFLPLYAKDSGITELGIGIIFSTFYIVTSFFAVFLGWITDRVKGARWLLMLAISLNILSCTVIVLNASFLSMLFARIFQGIAMASLAPLIRTIAVEFFGITRGIGIIELFYSMGSFIGSIVGGIVAELFSLAMTFTLSALLLSVPLISLIISSRTYSLNYGKANEGLNTSFLSALGTVIKSRIATSIYITIFLRHTGACAVWAIYPLYIRYLGGNNVVIGISAAVSTLVSALFMKRASELAYRYGLRTLTLGTLFSLLVFVGYMLTPTAVLVIPIQVLLGVGWSLLLVGAEISLIRVVGASIRGTALGLLNTSLSLAATIGSIIGGFLAEVLNYRATIAFAISACSLAFMVSVLSEKRTSLNLE